MFKYIQYMYVYAANFTSQIPVAIGILHVHSNFSGLRTPTVNLTERKENLFNNQELLQLVIISFIFVTLMFDSG